MEVTLATVESLFGWTEQAVSLARLLLFALLSTLSARAREAAATAPAAVGGGSGGGGGVSMGSGGGCGAAGHPAALLTVRCKRQLIVLLLNRLTSANGKLDTCGFAPQMHVIVCFIIYSCTYTNYTSALLVLHCVQYTEHLLSLSELVEDFVF